MANAEHLDILGRGIDAWNSWRNRNPSIKPNLQNADLENFDLGDLNLDGVNFRTTKLTDAKLMNSSCVKANFSEAFFLMTQIVDCDLGGAILTNAEVIGANFEHCDLNESNWRNADVSETYFHRSTLVDTDFTDISLSHSSFAMCDLSKVIGLNQITHNSPSTIGIDTLYLSNGAIDEEFLKKTGVPEEFITYAKSLVTKPIEFYSCFISFTEKDNLFSERLYNDMQAAGIRCWRWKEDAKWGKTLRKSIDEAVRIYDKLVIICSKDSLNAPAVLEEIEKALNKEAAQIKDGREGEVLFPITIDNYIFNGWEHYLKDRLLHKTIGDFKGWKRSPEKYKKSLDRLIRDLNKHS